MSLALQGSLVTVSGNGREQMTQGTEQIRLACYIRDIDTDGV